MSRYARIALAAAVILVVAAGRGLQAQRVVQPPSLQLGAQIIALRQDDYFSSAWSPGLGLTLRLPLFRPIAGQLSFSGAHTRRWEELACLATGSCPAPRKVSGSTTTVTASVGVDLKSGDYVGFAGLGYGRMWDYQPGGMIEYGGPTWVWDISVQRMIEPNVGVEFGYRMLRMSWDNEWESVLQGIHMTHHRLAVGVTYSPWGQSG